MHAYKKLMFGLLICLLGLCVSCDDAANSSPSGPENQASADTASSTQEIEVSKIHPGPVVHKPLSPAIKERIKKLHEIFIEVDHSSLETWMNNFSRDVNVESEVKIYEDMALAYEKFCQNRDLTLESRKEAYTLVLLRSMMSSTDVLKRHVFKHLTHEDAKELLAGYPGLPKPITVIKDTD